MLCTRTPQSSGGEERPRGFIGPNTQVNVGTGNMNRRWTGPRNQVFAFDIILKMNPSLGSFDKNKYLASDDPFLPVIKCIDKISNLKEKTQPFYKMCITIWVREYSAQKHFSEST